jgi:hypothetical protein
MVAKLGSHFVSMSANAEGTLPALYERLLDLIIKAALKPRDCDGSCTDVRC